jgi:hypothetical protein
MEIVKIETNHSLLIIHVNHKNINGITLHYCCDNYGNSHYDDDGDDNSNCRLYTYERMNYTVGDLEGKRFGNYFKIVSFPEEEEM